MKILTILAMTLISVSSFAQVPTRGNPYPRPTPSQGTQLITVQPGTSTYVQAYLPTQVFCEYAQAPNNPIPAPAFKAVQFYNGNDNCGAGFVADIRFSGNYEVDQEACRMKSTALGNPRVWSMSIDGRCLDISDTSFAAACAAAM